jgi:hypothetical protein
MLLLWRMGRYLQLTVVNSLSQCAYVRAQVRFGGGQHVKEGWWCYDALGAGRGRQGNCKRYRIAPNTACVNIC